MATGGPQFHGSSEGVEISKSVLVSIVAWLAIVSYERNDRESIAKEGPWPAGERRAGWVG